MNESGTNTRHARPGANTSAALLAGASGLIGSYLQARLLAAQDISLLTSLVRRAPPTPAPAKLRELVVDFAALPPAADIGPVDDVYITLGTTIAKAGGTEAFRRVDFHAVLAVAKLGRVAGARRLLLVSSVDADPGSRNFYLRVKGEVEEAVAGLGYDELHLLRPSILLGPRPESRPAESLAKLAMPVADLFLRGPFDRYHSIDADRVAAAMVAAARRGRPGRHVYGHRQMVELAAGD